MAVEAPFEFLEMGEGEVRELTVLSVDEGLAVIAPRDGRPAKEIRVLRFAVPGDEKPHLPDYYDFSAQLAIPTLRALLVGEGKLPRRIRLTKYGTGPSGRFQVEDLGRVPGRV